MTEQSQLNNASRTGPGQCLDSKSAIVTGAGSGIGRALSLAFAGAGARLLLFDVDAAATQVVAAEIRASGAKETEVFAGSTANEDEVEAACRAAEARFGRIDILLNNAGIAMNKPSLDLSADDWRRTVDINLTGVFLFAQATARRMSAAGRGVIINTASMYGVAAAPERAAYCSSKAAVVALTKVLAIEWAGLGIRVNAIGPGYVQTPLMEELARQGRVDIDALVRRTPARRLGTPEEMARIALFLASDDAAFITGQTIVADGGWTAYGYI